MKLQRHIQKTDDTLFRHKVDLAHLCAYSTDSANVNFVKFHSVYKLFREENKQFLPSKYPVYLVYKAAKRRCGLLTCDNEVL